MSTQKDDDAVLDTTWVVLHKPSGLWWRANRCGYTNELMAAGAYSEEEAKQCERTRSPHILPDGSRDYEEKAMTLRDALCGLGPGSVGALLGMRQSDG